jgi:hypothetical protein
MNLKPIPYQFTSAKPNWLKQMCKHGWKTNENGRIQELTMLDQEVQS